MTDFGQSVRDMRKWTADSEALRVAATEAPDSPIREPQVRQFLVKAKAALALRHDNAEASAYDAIAAFLTADSPIREQALGEGGREGLRATAQWWAERDWSVVAASEAARRFRAALTEASPEPLLDVERLAAAIHIVRGHTDDPSRRTIPHPHPINEQYRKEAAEIAAAYRADAKP